MVRRLSALTRRCGCGHYMFVNCAPAKCFCLPDIGRHRRLCARGNGRGNGGAMRNCCPCARLALRFWRGALPLRTVGIAVLAGRFALAHGWYRVPVAALFLGSRSAVRFCRGALSSRAVGLAVLAGRFVLARGWLCVPVAALFLGSRSAVRFCRGALSSRAVGLAVLAGRLSSVRARHCVPVAALFLGSRLLFVLRQTGRLAICSVPIPPGRDRHSRVLAVSVRLSALAGSLRVWPFLYGDPDGGRRDAEDAGTGNGVGGES